MVQLKEIYELPTMEVVNLSQLGVVCTSTSTGKEDDEPWPW